MRTNIYVDAFNLYYGCLRGTPYRWLDLYKLCHLLLPKDNIHRIKYFTAHISARPNDPDQPARQQAYLRALLTLPNVSIFYGHFLSHEVMMPLASLTTSGNPQYVKVIKTEEKGSDVNLATHLLYDAFQNDYDIAILITNDSDLVEPVKIVRHELGKVIGILNPHKHPSIELRAHATFFKQIRNGLLAASQFPPTLTDNNGTFSKPAGW